MLVRHLIETGVVVGAAIVVAEVVGALLVRGAADRYARRYVKRAVRFVAFLVAVVVLAFVWNLFSHNAGLVFGLVAAGFTFALQEVVGAIAGWFNILLGGIYRIGDRIELAGVHGDVIDITPLRTKLLETGVSEPPPVGSPATTDYWVHGRQPTGRIVAVSNKATFDSPVFNYSGMFEYVWQELTVPISHRDDWRVARGIVDEAVRDVSATDAAQEALDRMRERYAVPITELEPSVFVRATDNYMELAARFLVPVRSSRTTTTELTARIRDRLDAAGIAIASTTTDVTVYAPDGDR